MIPSNNENNKNILEPIRETLDMSEFSEICLNIEEQGNLTNCFEINNNTLEAGRE